jgi:hypothetical protein
MIMNVIEFKKGLLEKEALSEINSSPFTAGLKPQAKLQKIIY